jgi:hypothetical protein
MFFFLSRGANYGADDVSMARSELALHWAQSLFLKKNIQMDTGFYFFTKARFIIIKRTCIGCSLMLSYKNTHIKFIFEIN